MLSKERARLNICLLVAAGFILTLTLSICVVGVFYYVLVEQESESVLSPSDAELFTSRSAESAPLITTDTFDDLIDARHIDMGTVGQAISSPDGRWLTIAMGRDILLYESAAFGTAITLRGHAGDVSGMAFATHPERGTVLVSGAVDDSTIIVWDIQTGEQIWRLSAGDGWIRSLAASPTAPIVAGSSTDATIKLWDIATGKLIGTMEGHTKVVSDLDFHPDGTRIASTSRDGTVRLWDVEERAEVMEPRPLYSLLAHTTNTTRTSAVIPTGISFHPDGEHLAVGATDSVVRILSLATQEVVEELRGHTDWVVLHGVSYSPDGTTLTTASLDGTVRLWDAEGGEPLHILSHQEIELLSASWFPDSKRLIATSHMSGHVWVWDVAEEKIVNQLPLAQGEIIALDYSPTSEYLATMGANGTVRIYVLGENEHVTVAGGGRSSQPIAFLNALNATDLAIATQDEAGRVVVFDMTQAKRPLTLKPFDGRATAVAAHPSEPILAIGTEEGTVTLWDIARNNRIRTLPALDGGIEMMAFSTDGTYLIGCNDVAGYQSNSRPTLGVWRVQKGELVHEMHGHSDTITALAVQPAAPYVATVSNDGTVRLWNYQRGAEEANVVAGDDLFLFTSVAFSPDGTFFVTGSPDGMITLRDPRTAKEQHRLDLPGQGVFALQVRPDGRQIAVSTNHHGVSLVEVGP